MDDPQKIARIKHDRFVEEVMMRQKYARDALLADLAQRGRADGGAWTGPTLKLGREIGGELAAGLVKIHMETVGPDKLDYGETAKWIHRDVKRLWDSLAQRYLGRNRDQKFLWGQARNQAMPHCSNIEQDLRVAAFEMKGREGVERKEVEESQRRIVVEDLAAKVRGEIVQYAARAATNGFKPGVEPLADIVGKHALEMVRLLAPAFGGDKAGAEVIAGDLAKLRAESGKDVLGMLGITAEQWDEATRPKMPPAQRIADEIKIAIADQRVQIGQQVNIAGANSGNFVGRDAHVQGGMTGTGQAKEGVSWGDVLKKVWGSLKGLFGGK